MARPKKPQEQKTLKVGIEDFIRTRDSVVTGLATLQSAVQDLSRAYIAHTNTVIGKGAGPSLELLTFANPLGSENGLFNPGRLATPAPAPEQDEGKKKRKRAPHDKNAPKRPVTPYFLYMSFGRDGIAKGMGAGTTAKQVADEGTRRWNTMGEEERQLWQKKYAANYIAYKEKVKAYKLGLPIPEFSEEQILQMYKEQHGDEGATIPPPEAPSEHDEKSASEGEEESDATSSEESSPEPAKTVSPPKSPRASKRGKGAKGKVEKIATPVKSPSPIQQTPKSPDTDIKGKKTAKKRGAKAADEIPDPKKEMQENAGSSPAKRKKEIDSKPKRKKRKSEAADA